jgi:hypothetical protein
MDTPNKIIADTLTAINSLFGYRIDLGWIFDALLDVGNVTVLDGRGRRLRVSPSTAEFIRGIEIKKPTEDRVFGSCIKRWWISEDESGRRTVNMKQVLLCHSYMDKMIDGMRELIENNKYENYGRNNGSNYKISLSMHYGYCEIPFRIEEKKELAKLIEIYAGGEPDIKCSATLGQTLDEICRRHGAKSSR